MNLLKKTLNSLFCCSHLPSVDSTGTSYHSEVDTVLGVELGASGMLDEHSTNWGTSPDNTEIQMALKTEAPRGHHAG